MSCTGTVKFFNFNKGFGFLSTEQGDVFVHASQIREQCLNEGDQVYFDMEFNEMKGNQTALNVVGGTGGPVEEMMSMRKGGDKGFGKGKGKGFGKGFDNGFKGGFDKGFGGFNKGFDKGFGGKGFDNGKGWGGDMGGFNKGFDKGWGGDMGFNKGY